MEQTINIEVLEVEQFSIIHILSNPPRIESNVVFDRDNISQKLIFTLMEISHNHGFGCSPPHFKGPDDSTMTFLIGTILPTKKSFQKYTKKMYSCLLDIYEFASEFSRQLDFSQLDLSMFVGIDIDGFFPEQIAAVRDQHYNGSWVDFHDDLLDKENGLEIDVIERCIKFEKINDKDIGLVGHKLSYIIQMLDESESIGMEKN